MGIRGKFLLLMTAFSLIIIGSSYYLINNSNKKLIELEAVRIADIVSNQVLADRAIYTKEIVQKLQKDGTGAIRDFHNNKGYVLLPAQFARAVSNKVNKNNKDLYQYYLRSKWNLNTKQGLQDDFDSWAWQQLENQERDKPKDTKNWNSFYRFEQVNQNKVLRYYKADITSAQACADCHNAYEKRPDVIAMRKASGTKPGKQWKLNQLMGAIRVEVPINTVEALANSSRDTLLLSLFGLFIAGFIIMMIAIIKAIIKPIENSIKDLNNFSSKINSVVDCSRGSLKAADKQVQIYKDVKNQKVKISLNELSDMANQGAVNAEDSASHCIELKEAFNESKKKFSKMIGEKS